MACGRRKAVVEFLLFRVLRLFRIGDKRGLGDRRISGSISAGAPARTVAPAMSAMSLMLVIYIWLYFSGSLHADNSTPSAARIWDQSPTPRRDCCRGARRGESRLKLNLRRLKVEPDASAGQLLVSLMISVADVPEAHSRGICTPRRLSLLVFLPPFFSLYVYINKRRISGLLTR